jgi:type I restriction enzyme M protein
MRRSNCAGAMQYVPELTWLLFLRILDLREKREEETAEVLGNTFTPSLANPYRWTKAYCSVPTKPPLFKPNGNSWMTARSTVS